MPLTHVPPQMAQLQWLELAETDRQLEKAEVEQRMTQADAEWGVVKEGIYLVLSVP